MDTCLDNSIEEVQRSKSARYKGIGPHTESTKSRENAATDVLRLRAQLRKRRTLSPDQSAGLKKTGRQLRLEFHPGYHLAVLYSMYGCLGTALVQSGRRNEHRTR